MPMPSLTCRACCCCCCLVREGIVLHDVQWQEDDKLRPVLHRLSLVEMAVPYADPR